MGTVGEGGRYGGIYMLGALVQEGRGWGEGWLVPLAGFAESMGHACRFSLFFLTAVAVGV